MIKDTLSGRISFNLSEVEINELEKELHLGVFWKDSQNCLHPNGNIAKSLHQSENGLKISNENFFKELDSLISCCEDESTLNSLPAFKRFHSSFKGNAILWGSKMESNAYCFNDRNNNIPLTLTSSESSISDTIRCDDPFKNQIMMDMAPHSAEFPTAIPNERDFLSNVDKKAFMHNNGEMKSYSQRSSPRIFNCESDYKTYANHYLCATSHLESLISNVEVDFHNILTKNNQCQYAISKGKKFILKETFGCGQQNSDVIPMQASLKERQTEQRIHATRHVLGALNKLVLQRKYYLWANNISEMKNENLRKANAIIQIQCFIQRMFTAIRRKNRKKAIFHMLIILRNYLMNMILWKWNFFVLKSKKGQKYSLGVLKVQCFIRKKLIKARTKKSKARRNAVVKQEKVFHVNSMETVCRLWDFRSFSSLKKSNERKKIVELIDNFEKSKHASLNIYQKINKVQHEIANTIKHALYEINNECSSTKWSFIQLGRSYRLQNSKHQIESSDVKVEDKNSRREPDSKSSERSGQCLFCECKLAEYEKSSQLSLGKGISDEMLEGLGPLPKIKSLALDVEGIENAAAISSKLLGASSLMSISLNVNKVSPDLCCFDGLPNLRNLSLNDNNIISLRGIDRLLSLNNLQIENNYLHCLHPLGTSGYQFPLKHINASRNQIKLLPNCLSSTTPSLENISLYQNMIDFIPQSFLQGLNFLITIDLGRNRLEDSKMLGKALSEAPTLRKILLSQNRLKELPSPLHLPLLDELWLSENKISSTSNWNTSKDVWLPCLTELHLKDNCIPCIESFSLALSCPNVKLLDFSFNKLYSIENISSALEGLARLECICLADNNLVESTSCMNQRAALLQASPSLRKIDRIHISTAEIWTHFARFHTRESFFLYSTLKALTRNNISVRLIMDGNAVYSLWEQQTNQIECSKCKHLLDIEMYSKGRYPFQCPFCSRNIIPTPSTPILLDFESLERFENIRRLNSNCTIVSINEYLSMCCTISKKYRKQIRLFKKQKKDYDFDSPDIESKSDLLSLSSKKSSTEQIRQKNQKDLRYDYFTWCSDVTVSKWKSDLMYKLELKVKVDAIIVIQVWARQLISKRESKIFQMNKNVKNESVKMIYRCENGKFTAAQHAGMVNYRCLIQDDTQKLFRWNKPQQYDELNSSGKYMSKFNNKNVKKMKMKRETQSSNINLLPLRMERQLNIKQSYTTERYTKKISRKNKVSKRQAAIMKEWGLTNPKIAETMIKRKRQMMRHNS